VLTNAGNSEGFGGAWSGSGAGGDALVRTARKACPVTARRRGGVLIKAGNSEGFGGAWRVTGAGGDVLIRIAGGASGATFRGDAVLVKAGNSYSPSGLLGGIGATWRVTGAAGDELTRIAGGASGATLRGDAVIPVEMGSCTDGKTRTGCRFTGLGSEPHKLSDAFGGLGKFFLDDIVVNFTV